jgi:hypothetical protein
MTELSTYQPEPVDLPAVFESDLIRWARDAREAHAIATSLVTTSFVPDSMRGKPHEAAAAILTGAEIGLTPMAALRSIDIIQGTPAMRAHALRGLVQSRGHDVWVHEATGSRAVVQGRRKGSQAVQESVWTLDRAKALGLLNKQNWKTQPQAMLVARATSELCRLIASDVLLGIPYSVEELDDEAADLEAVSAPKAVKRTVKRQTQPEVAPPPLDDPVAVPSGPGAASTTVGGRPVENVEVTEPAFDGYEGKDEDWPEVAKPGEGNE